MEKIVWKISWPKKEEPKGDIKFSKEFREERSKKTEESMKEVVPKFDTINEKSVRLSLFNFYSKIKAAIAPSKDNRNFRSPIYKQLRLLHLKNLSFLSYCNF